MFDVKDQQHHTALGRNQSLNVHVVFEGTYSIQELDNKVSWIFVLALQYWWVQNYQRVTQYQ